MEKIIKTSISNPDLFLKQIVIIFLLINVFYQVIVNLPSISPSGRSHIRKASNIALQVLKEVVRCAVVDNTADGFLVIIKRSPYTLGTLYHT